MVTAFTPPAAELQLSQAEKCLDPRGAGRTADASIVALASVWIALNVATAAIIEPSDPNGVDRKMALLRVTSRFESHSLPASGGAAHSHFIRDYRLFVPSLAANGRPLPVVLFLHGSGQRGNDNMAQLQTLPAHLADPDVERRFPCFVLVPQCPADSSWTAPGFPRGDSVADCAVDDVVRMLDEVLERYPADPNRIYLIGYSMGGYGAWELAIRHPDRFAAVVPVAGGGSPERAAALREVPVWAVHGANDKTIPPEESRQMIAAIRESGGTPNLSELPNVAHGSLRPALIESDEILRWMFSQSRGSDRLRATRPQSTIQ